MKTSPNNIHDSRLHDSCKPLLDHLAAELAKEYVRLMKQPADEHNSPNGEDKSCVLPFTPATAQRANAKRA